ncbi:MAG TPA: hypothetical protein VHO50_05985 [Bacteroidales bacterium]|nr:hypothetical protein [Bacteroidales bacterium]
MSKILRIRYFVRLLLIVFLSAILNFTSEAQYFGRNKPGYKKFNFTVAQTPHFDIYNYLKNDTLINVVSQWSERWYSMHQKMFRDTFDVRNPIILYSNHADFQQTNAISELVGVGTGGVTESLKNRVIIPVAPSIAQTDHVLGHEMVHAFQYHMFLNERTRSEFSLNNVPLWMIEGMAEYLSKGSVDPHTAMVMRDALLNNDFPTLKKLSTESKYFPYTYGQAFWSLVVKTWGDKVMVPLLKNTAIMGFDRAADSLLKVDETTLSGMWKSATELHYRKFLKNEKDSVAGTKLISEDNAGEMNISPSISPDGKYIAFFSEKDLFTLDLYLAETQTGKIIKKLTSVVKNDEIDDFNFIESSGTWSPDSRKFAFVVFSKGKNKMAILEVKKGKINDEFEIPGVPSFSNPAWSPDGKKFVISGLVEGITNLYLYDYRSGDVEKITDDFTADIHPSWSSDGSMIVFSKENMAEGENIRNYTFNLAIMNLETRSVKTIDVFRKSYNMNPLFSIDNKSIFFLSDADGYRNMYRYDIDSGEVFRMTEYMTGVSGITDFSPALSIAKNDNILAYNYFIKDSYQIFLAKNSDFKYEKLDTQFFDYTASTLPPITEITETTVDNSIFTINEKPVINPDSIRELTYRPKFKLDYISNNANIGISTGGLYRDNLGGSINMIFSDMVGNNQIYSSLSLNGEIYDFGGMVAYLNQKGKVKWSAALSHIPYQTGGMYIVPDTVSVNNQPVPVDNLIIDYMRIFEDNISLSAAVPLSQTRRFEGGIAASWYNYRIDRFNNYYLPNGVAIGGNRKKVDAPGGESFQQISLAYVEDNSFNGITAPMQGHRMRFQVDRYFGDANLYTTLIDYRKYFFVKPMSFAIRLYNYGLWGASSGSAALPQLYLGNPWYIHGYENVNNTGQGNGSFDISWLSGSKIALANAEIRFPFTGPERLSLIKSKYLLTDLNLFFDAGMAWNKDNTINFDASPNVDFNSNSRTPLLSTGVSVRLNLFGYMVIEPYYAIPLSNGGFKNGAFGLNFLPGW